MGCDIHCYIEFKEPGNNGWNPFGGKTYVGRNYAMFAALAGVRGDGPPAKGLPEDIAYEAQGDNRLFITEDGDGDGEARREQAVKWVADGLSKYVPEDNPRWVTHPDWHSHSWATREEWESALTKASTHYVAGIRYYALLAVLRFFESQGIETRVVYWFDN